MGENKEKQKTLGLLSGCSIIVGSIIGSGIFITAKNILENCGGVPGLSLIVWLISGGISLIGAICYTELGTLIQRDGGNYAYISESYGGLLSFLYVWIMVFVTIPSYCSICALTISKYLIKPFFQECDSPLLADKLIAIVIIITVGLVNSLSVKIVSRVHVVFTLSKIIALLIIISAGLWLFFNSSINFENTVKDWFPNDKPFRIEKFVISIYNCFFAYSGWNNLNFLTGQLKNPTKNLPRALYISIPSCIFIYFITTVAYFLVLTPKEVLQSETIAITFTAKVLHKSFSWLTPFLISFSTFGSVSGFMLAVSRLYCAAAKDGNLPDIFATVNLSSFSPIVSIIFFVLLSALMLLTDSLDGLILTATFTDFLFIGIAVSTILFLRYKMPDVQRDIKVFIGYPIFFLCICIFMVVLTVYDQPQKAFMGLLFLLSGIPVYYLTIVWKQKPKSYKRFMKRFTILLQKLFLCIKEH